VLRPSVNRGGRSLYQGQCFRRRLMTDAVRARRRDRQEGGKKTPLIPTASHSYTITGRRAVFNGRRDRAMVGRGICVPGRHRLRCLNREQALGLVQRCRRPIKPSRMSSWRPRHDAWTPPARWVINVGGGTPVGYLTSIRLKPCSDIGTGNCSHWNRHLLQPRRGDTPLSRFHRGAQLRIPANIVWHYRKHPATTGTTLRPSR